MKFTDIFVNRPVLASVISLLILLIGARSIGLLELREYPETKTTVVTVTTAYPGADSQLVQSFITEPLQRAVSEARGIDFVTSTSTQGLSVIEIQMELNYDPNAAIAEIQAKVASQRNILPEDAKDPVIDSTTGSNFALMYLAYFSEEMNPAQITDYLLRTVIPKIQAVPGVAKAEIMGNQSFAMRVWLDPKRMAAHNVSPLDVEEALRRNNYQAGIGRTEADYVSINLSADTDIGDEEAFQELVVRAEGDTLVRLKDVADVELGIRNYDRTSWYNGNMAILVAVQQAPGANPLVVAQDVRDLLPEIEAQLPESMEFFLPHDGSEYIEDSIDEVFQTLGEAVIIVLLVVYLALGSWHAAIVPAVAVPLSLVGAAFIMLLAGFSINLLTLLAMLLAIGLVVDDAIVVVENVHRHIMEGKPPLEAARIGARELALPIVSMTTTLLAVYAPIGFMGGLVGTLFTEFAFALAGAVLISGIVALTLSPMMSSRVLAGATEPGKFEKMVERFFENLSTRYKRALSSTINYLPVVMVFAGTVLVSIYFMFVTSTSELAPQEDKHVLNIFARAPQTATLEYTTAYTRQMVETFETFPEYARSFIMIGQGGSPAETFGGFRLIDPEHRDITPMELAPRMQQKLSKIAGLEIVVFSRPPLPGSAGGTPVQFVITTSQDYTQLDRVADQMMGRAMASGNFVFMRKSIELALPRNKVKVDRERAADLGIDMREIGASLATLVGDNNVNRFSLMGRSYEVVPQVSREYRQNRQMLWGYYVRADNGSLAPLASVVDFDQEVEPTKRTQFQQLNSLTLDAVMAPGVSLGEALTYLEGQAAEVFPKEFTYDFTGESRQFIQQGSALVATFFLSILVIYLVLAAQFESWRDPLIILVSVPMSIAGAMIFVTLGFATVNIYTQVGLITLIGLIAKNGILIVDFANHQQINVGLSKRDAVLEAAAIRLRPILMTTAAMIMAMIPLLIATGPGAASRFQIGLVISTGLGIGTLFTLFVVPAVYMMLARDHRADSAQQAEGETTPTTA